MPDESLTPEQTADRDDGGWSVESHSASAEPTPADTTAEADRAASPTPVAAPPATDDAEPESEASPEGDEVSRSAAAAAGPEAKPAAKPASKKRGDIERRQASLTRQIDELTHQKHATQRELDDARAQVAKIREEIAALEAKKPGAPATKPETPPADAMPAHPQYKDFETDADYEAAVATWRTDVLAWQAAREQALKDDITKGLETRLTSERQTVAQERAAEAFRTRLETVAASHEDWDAVMPSLKDLRSPWARDPQQPTPFLSDVVAHTEDGPELLYWLATHPDEAQTLAELHPTRELRDAVIQSSSAQMLLEHFATPDGQAAFETLKRMPPTRQVLAVGALSAQLAGASRGPSAPAPHPITQAVPSAKPPAGSPRARTDTSPVDPSKQSFQDWMAQEDAREAAERKRLLGVA